MGQNGHLWHYAAIRRSPRAVRKTNYDRINQLLSRTLPHQLAWQLPELGLALQRYYYCVAERTGFSVGTHTHDWYELSEVVAGEVEYRDATRTRRIGPGELFFMAPGWSHSWTVSRGPAVISSFQLRLHPQGPRGRRFVAALHALSSEHHFRLLPSPSMREASQAWSEALGRRSTPLLPLKLAAWFQLYLCGFFERALGRSLGPAVVATQAGLRRPSATQLASFIAENIHRPIQLEDISSHFQYSPRHVGRLFRQAHGMAIGSYIGRQKLAAAKQLLATSTSSVKEIAHSLGYADAGYFGRFFRLQTGLSPAHYRQRETKR